ncbi:hypothetical protein VNO77_18323 [Canavalia gladiata]|uniref:Uncharacterized protein n=1 Tax=Canavalia gladiata TaxID=3824 RepID=A0AAN9LKL6_CANGL
MDYLQIRLSFGESPSTISNGPNLRQERKVREKVRERRREILMTSQSNFPISNHLWSSLLSVPSLSLSL